MHSRNRFPIPDHRILLMIRVSEGMSGRCRSRAMLYRAPSAVLICFVILSSFWLNTQHFSTTVTFIRNQILEQTGYNKSMIFPQKAFGCVRKTLQVVSFNIKQLFFFSMHA